MTSGEVWALIAGAILVIGSVAMLTASMGVLLRANEGRRVSYWGSPDVIPRRSTLYRVIGAGLMAISVPFLAPTIGMWTAAVAAFVFVPGFVLLVGHNRALPAAGTDENADGLGAAG